jgi:glycine/D-amino acid oxidase-like deaminating enzyme/nitrite reductase/ring-hydroxylating ferredoxin subunit
MGSFWRATFDVPDSPPLQEDLHVDVCVVGAGMVGLSIAYLLTKAGKSVAVLDDGPMVGGMSGATTAHLTCVLDERYIDLERMHGAEGARLAAESHMTAINRIETIVNSERIDCDFERLNGYLFSARDEDDDMLVREMAAAQRAGIDAALVDNPPKPSLETGRCLLFPNQAQFHPLKYSLGLARAIERDGGRIFTMTHADRIEGGAPSEVEAGGHVVYARDVVVATLSPVIRAGTIHTKQTAWMTYVLGAPVPRGAVHRALYWDSGFPYHYARVQNAPAALGPDSDLLIVGGEDHRTGQEEDTAEHHIRLEAWARDRFPMIEEIHYAWSGEVIQSADGLAHIGRNPENGEHVFIVTGDSGSGMTYATISAILLTDLIEGRSNPWEALFDPSRTSLRALPKRAGEAARAAVHYKDKVIPPGDVKTADDIAPDAGAVLSEGLSRIAAYRAPDGTLHRMSAVCTHLGCIVQWNGTERSWDCPCHGSRYDRFGTVINGPANANLDPR